MEEYDLIDAVVARVGCTDDDVEDVIGWLATPDGFLLDPEDGRLADRRRIVDRLALVHVLDDVEITCDALRLEPDLSPLVHGWTDDWHLPAGGLVAFTFAEGERLAPLREHDLDAVLAGPSGWLAGHRPGDAVVVRAVGERIDVAAFDDHVDDHDRSAAVRAVRTAFDHLEGEDGVTGVGEVVEVAALEGVLCRPFGPVTEVLAASGLEARGHEVARDGFDWAALDRRRALRRAAGDAMHALAVAPQTAGMVALLTERFGDHLLGGSLSDVEWAQVGEWLAFPLAAECLATAVLTHDADDETIAALDAFADSVVRASPSSHGGSRLVEALADHRDGRGTVPHVARNAACPCGSGRKYKFCHGNRRVGDPAMSEIPDDAREAVAEAGEVAADVAPGDDTPHADPRPPAPDPDEPLIIFPPD